MHACTQQAALEPLVRKAHAVLGAVEARRRWQDAEPVLGAAAELGAACEGVQAALSRYAEGEAAAAAAASAGEGGQAAYTQHERQAAELQAALAAAAAAQQGLEGDDGWATVSRGGGSRLADEQEPEDEVGGLGRRAGARIWGAWRCGVRPALKWLRGALCLVPASQAPS